MPRKISCILYRYPIPVFGGFVQFQTKYVTDETSMREMFSTYIESHAQISFIEMYIEFEQSEADRNIEREDYNSDSEEEFESNYEVVGPDGDEDQGDGTMTPKVTDVANALANKHPFQEPSFMRALDLEAMHAPEFPEYMNAGYSRTVRVYELRYQHLRERGEAYTNWLNQIPTNNMRWHSMVVTDGGHMTTNLMECINSVLKGARNLPITAIVKATFYMLNELFTRKRAETVAQIYVVDMFFLSL
nr:uncharacterized protein LOC112769103 [Arachis hypogaea]